MGKVLNQVTKEESKAEVRMDVGADEDLAMVEQELNKEDSSAVDFNMQEANTGSTSSFIDRGVVSIGEYKVIKALTKSPILSAGVTIAGQAIGVLPKSVAPVLGAVGSMVGKDSKVGSMLTGFADKLSPKPDTEARFAIKDNLLSDMKGDYTPETFVENMGKNGAETVKTGAFLSKDISEDSALGGQIVSNALDALDNRVMDMAGTGGKLSHGDKVKCDEYYKNLKAGFDEYQEKAEAEIDEMYDGKDAETAKKNLQDFVDTSMNEIDTHMKEMDKQYGFAGASKSQDKRKEEKKADKGDDKKNAHEKRVALAEVNLPGSVSTSMDTGMDY